MCTRTCLRGMLVCSRSLSQFDIEARQPGCDDTSPLFLDMWKSSLFLIAQYSLPSLALIHGLHIVLMLLIHGFDCLSPEWKSKHLLLRARVKAVYTWMGIRFATVCVADDFRDLFYNR